MAKYNPTSQLTKGEEWVPLVVSGVLIDSAGQAPMARVPSLASQNVGGVMVDIAEVIAPGTFQLDVYEAGLEASAGSGLVIARPNEDVAVVNLQGVAVNTAGNRYQNVDESVLDGTDYLRGASAAGVGFGGQMNASWRGRFGFGTGLFVSKTILSVTLKAYYHITATANDAYIGQDFGLFIGGVFYPYTTADQAAKMGVHYAGGTPWAWIGEMNPILASATWRKNPATGAAWTAADVEKFDTTDSAILGIVEQQNGGTPGSVHLEQAWMEAATIGEARVATGSVAISSAGYITVPLLTPAGGTWAKVTGHTYEYVLRRVGSSGAVRWRTLDSGTLMPEGHTSAVVALTDGVIVDTDDIGPTKTAVHAIIPRTTAPANSIDAQPYAEVVPALTKSFQDTQLDFSAAAAATYGTVTVICKHGGNPSANLFIAVRKRSDASQIGGFLVITKAMCDAAPEVGDGWHRVVENLQTLAPLATGTQYFLNASASLSGVGADAWYIAALDTTGSGNDQGYGSASSPVDQGTVNGVRSPRYAPMMTISQVLTTDRALHHEVRVQSLDVADDSGCSVSRWEYVHLAWNASAYGAQFDYYEVQRSEDHGVTWVTIARRNTEASPSYDDYGCARGVAVRHRIRPVLISGSPEAWSTMGSGEVTCRASGYEVGLISDTDPSLNLAFEWKGGGDTTYTFPSEDNRELLELYGRDYFVEEMGTEERGVRFQFSVIVGTTNDPPPGGTGAKAFAPLRALISNATLPYVIYLDSLGNRHYATIKFLSGTRRQRRSSAWYVANLELSEVEGPVVVEA